MYNMTRISVAEGMAKELPKAVAREVAKEILNKTDTLQKRLNLSLEVVLVAMDMTMEEYENLKILTESKE